MDYLPHRKPMVWVDEVISAKDIEGGVESDLAVHLDKQAHYFQSDGRLRSTSPIEWMAQAYGYASASLLKKNGIRKNPKRAFLVGIRNYCVDMSLLNSKDSNTLIISVKTLKVLGPLAIFKGELMDSRSRQKIAEGEIKVFFEEEQSFEV